MAVSVSDLDEARPQQWRDAADDVLAAARQCDELGDHARNEVAATLKQCWVGEAGRAARERFVEHADDYEAAALALRAMARAYDELANAVENAQRDLRGGLDYARRNGLVVDESGRVQFSQDDLVEGDAPEKALLTQAHEVIADALYKANEADADAARALRTVEGMILLRDPKLVREALDGGPLAVALRLSHGLETDIHPINVPRHVLDSVKTASAETGISRKLLLAVLWQEQQWYQNHSPGLSGPVTEAGRFLNWAASQTLKPDKSLGITHIKPATARRVLDEYPNRFRLTDGRTLNDATDAELAAEIESNPQLDVRLSAHYLAMLQEDEHGATTDKQLFTLYAADSSDVREKNEQFGDDSDYRGHSIQARGRNWDRIEPHLDDAMAWHDLTDGERTRAMEQLESQTPAGHHVALAPIYATEGPTTGSGTGEPEPGTPSPSPGPAPRPPGD
ncbi:hypothetical protein [Streptomyces sp. NPDC002490]|uniref:hypothetical protein n=1 Tax=Streptomyces sp. NPDC002490 TaxID=3154416 RepID=UPI0033197E2B